MMAAATLDKKKQQQALATTKNVVSAYVRGGESFRRGTELTFLAGSKTENKSGKRESD